jgi:hypothetical protein
LPDRAAGSPERYPAASRRWGDIVLPSLYLFFNVPFVVKYPVRAGVPVAVAIGSYMMGVILVWSVLRALRARVAVARPGWTVATGAALAALLLGVMKRFDPAVMRVARHAALDQWISRLLAGEFPYGASATPSSFPFMFAWAMPWYALGDLGLLQIASLVLFAALCASAAGSDQTRALGALVALVGAPIFLYEVVTRSELFSNMVLALLVLVLLERAHRLRALVPVAVAAGLALSTRGIVAVVGLVALPFRFRREPLAGLGFVAIAALVFLATWVPFLAWDRRDFLQFGPLSIQLSYAPRALVVAAMALALVLGGTARNARDVYRGIVLALAFPVAAVFLYSVATEGWKRVLLEDDFDISYFAFAHTFLIYTVARFGWSASPSHAPSVPSRASDPRIVSSSPAQDA